MFKTASKQNLFGYTIITVDGDDDGAEGCLPARVPDYF